MDIVYRAFLTRLVVGWLRAIKCSYLNEKKFWGFKIAYLKPKKIIPIMKSLNLILPFGLILLCGPFTWVYAVEKTVSKEDIFQKFETDMQGVRFSGFFTIDGSELPPTKETYEVHRVQKLGEEDLWVFTARIKYGKQDITLPIPLPVKWVGHIPVIAMENLPIPGLGTFSAHVVMDGNKYAGTWAHGKLGGHLYGTIDKINHPRE